MSTTQNSLFIKAPPEIIYQAFTDPSALVVWMAPGEMTGKIHDFNLSIGGGYRMSLYYPSGEKLSTGKTGPKEDRFSARFLELDPPRKIIQAIRFDTEDPCFTGEMIMEINLIPYQKGTRVSILFREIPIGILPADNDKGTQLSLEKLARFTEGKVS
ncbi:MAG: SRPBCC domain-containing protein [Flavisolibacter sp.]